MHATPRQRVELFHLLFLTELAVRLDARIFAVKGGCNLRLFFGSLRYSEDLDIDVAHAAVGTLRRKVEMILEGRPLRLAGQVHGIAVDEVSAPKQTETTQRFKILLGGDRRPVHTKIEFSRRGLDEGVVVASVDRAVLAGYALSPLLLPHYSRQPATEQKVRALAGRATTQARDVFDLDLLFGAGQVHLTGVPYDIRHAAAARALGLDFATFKSQVLAYLSPAVQAQYDDERLWTAMCIGVAERLEAR